MAMLEGVSKPNKAGRSAGEPRSDDEQELAREMARMNERARKRRAENERQEAEKEAAFRRRLARRLIEACARAHGEREPDRFEPLAAVLRESGTAEIEGITAISADIPAEWRRPSKDLQDLLDKGLVEEWAGPPGLPLTDPGWPEVNAEVSRMLVSGYWRPAVLALREAGEVRGPDGFLPEHPLAPLFVRAMRDLVGDDSEAEAALVRDLAELRKSQGPGRFNLGQYFKDLQFQGYPRDPESGPARTPDGSESTAGGPEGAAEAEQTPPGAEFVLRVSEEQYVLRQINGAWLLRFEGRESGIGDRLGILYLHRLMQRPGISVSALDLESPDRENHQAARDQAIDDRAADEAREQLEAIDAALADGVEPDVLEELEQRRVDISRYLAANTNRKGRPREVGEADKVRQRVGRQIERAIEHIRSLDPKAGEHFKKAVLRPTSANPVYAPQEGVTWLLV